MSLASSFRYYYYMFMPSKGILRKKARELFNVKIQSPFDSSEIITLGDLIISTGITEKEIIQIAESYGIKFPSQAIDISGNHALEYLLYHGEDLHYTYENAVGEKIIAGIEKLGNEKVVDALPLIPNSHLDVFIKWLEHSNEGFRSFYGHAAEFGVSEQLNSIGVKTIMPATSNNAGFDILCDREQFYDKFGIKLPKWDEDSTYGMVQIKSSSSLYDQAENFKSNTLEHFDKYPDIPVICSDKIHNALSEKFDEDMLISFKQIGINEENLEQTIKTQLDLLKGAIPDEVLEKLDISVGLDSSQFAEALSNSVDSSFHIPVIAVTIRGTLSAYKNIKRYKKGEISLDCALGNMLKDTSKTLVISTATITATKYVTDSLGLSVTDSANSVAESVADGFAFDDFDWENLGEIGLCIGIAVGIGWCIKKVWNFFAGDPLEEYKRLLQVKTDYLISVGPSFEKYHDSITEYIKPPEYDRTCKDITIVTNRLEELNKQRIKGLEYFALEYKLKVLNEAKDAFTSVIKSLDPVLNRINKLSNILLHCKNEDFKLKHLINSVKNLYSKQRQNVEKAFSKVENYQDFAFIVVVVLSSELNTLFSAIKQIEEPELQGIMSYLDTLDLQIKQEYNMQKAKGNIG